MPSKTLLGALTDLTLTTTALRRKLNWVGTQPVTDAHAEYLICVSSYSLYDISVMVFVDPIDLTFYRSTKIKDQSPVWERAELPAPTL